MNQFFPDWKQTFRNCDGSCRTRTLRKRQSSRGTTCWESLNRPFSNMPFSRRAVLSEHRDWICAQTAVPPLDMPFTISIIFLFAWSGSNQKNSTEIFICCLASAAPFLAWSLFTLGSLPRPLHGRRLHDTNKSGMLLPLSLTLLIRGIFLFIYC